MPKLLLLPALLWSLALSAQYNLVPNPSFEIYNTCPVTISGFDYYSDTYVDDWYSCGGGTSDYFNACAGAGSWVGVPENLFSLDQPAHTGVGYGGFWVDLYDDNSFIYREYCQAELIEPLVAGQCYYVEFWSAPATLSDFFGANHGTTDAIGAFLGTEKIGDPGDYGVLAETPQIDNNGTGNYIDPPALWTKVSGFFEAAGGESWIAVGNFHPDDEVEMVPYTGGPTDVSLVYLFVDDVLVSPVDSMTYLPDTISCNPVTLYAPEGADSYLWSTGATTSSITVFETGEYWVQINLPCTTVSDTALVQIVADSVYTTESVIQICFTELPYTLAADPTYEGYLWNTGETTSSIEITDGGVYVVNGFADCATFVDSFSVEVIPPMADIPNLQDTLICQSTWSLELNGPDGYDAYNWSTGATTQNITVSDAGTYSLTVESTCETLSDEMTITEDAYLLSDIDLGQDQYLCPPAGITEITIASDITLPDYQWNTGAETQAITVTEPGTYFVSYESLCKTLSDTIEITECIGLGIPTAFSPNNDGTNDQFMVVTLHPEDILSFNIYNRWGQLLFSGDAAHYAWDGTFNNTPQPMGSYVYVLHFLNDGVEEVLQGNFTLVR
ncbi:MAG TPA: gliding motility-associated C-terminal domain-containing protein [Chitinophagales bacterium]|nr:gliding motility-associated C-terminal domain-containing protein [Chitinophagales bacterium]HMZ90028.1 gliding motility-associated C-terminal domain-containing protein [Chitinophagales bacterium]HNA57252.1 gliding motility-associated C-terminal domain-containing protein [Chitinophagales bacterium]HNE46528.1 gliding motility-associated C-terminal domain-containing protein [Chitinophagales bacterium]HNI53461.1 gliding motility-associated C-terminal domain-containing protein [Chitinophagales ba